MAKEKGKGSGKATKKEPMNWAKIIIPLLMVFIMVGSIFAYISRPSDTGSQSQNIDKAFNGITDGLRLIPVNASNVRYADLRNDSLLAGSTQNYYWLFGTLPPTQVFNAGPQRDLFAIYPGGSFGNFNEQFVSLTDFGTAAINRSYPDYYEVNGVKAKKVNSQYYYTADTKPVVSGRMESVAPTLYTMMGDNESAYTQYSDLFNELKLMHIDTSGMTLEIVGNSNNLSYSDRFYAALKPMDNSNTSVNRTYEYVAIMHVNQTVPDVDYQNLALLENTMEKTGFQSYRTQVYDGYIVIQATGSLGPCIEDMLYRWGFIRYAAHT